MTGRLALIVGSQCERLQALPFIDDLAQHLQTALGEGGWRPALADGGWVKDPTTAELKSAVEQAFTAANEIGATLLIAFIGHGVADGTQDFYLMTWNSPPEMPNCGKPFSGMGGGPGRGHPVV
ncbi:hypothetical protein [Nocardia sp. NPDC059239]|uniref:hypothetical protein n=1 Tax=Nocardia sp. NPDC059239 TaxID=3346785 RepID=UPI0036C28294